jgi:Ca2+/H+ antiporter, TMEM165/GDT1 family
VNSLLAALGLVFVAELGDKTQLVAVGFGARHRLAPVVLGVVAAYTTTTLLSVLVGGLLGVSLPTRAIGLAGGVLFVGFAAWTLWSGDEGPDDAGVAALAARSDHRAVVMSVATAMFVAELGDKTMITTATLAAQGRPVLVWVGATIGMILSGTLAVLLGRSFGARLPSRAIRICSAVLFTVFGVALIGANL